MEKLNRDNFVPTDEYEDYEEFRNYIAKIGLDINCFYINEDSLLNLAWYIEEYVTIPLHTLSVEHLKFIKIKETIQRRKELIESRKKNKNYTGLFTLIEKPFRIAYFLNICDELEATEFLELFEFVWSSCEYNFDLLSNEYILQRIEEIRSIKNIKDRLIKKYNIKNDVVTIYRGEADKSTSFNNGAISWTLDYDIASFFANRFRANNPKIYKANVLIKDILMLIDNEQEVLVKKENLFNIEKINFL